MDRARNLLVKINGDASGFEKAMGSVEKSSGGISGAFTKATAGSKILAGAVLGAGAAAAGFGIMSVKAYSESQDALAQLNAVLKSTHGAAGLTTQDLTEQATALQKVTKFSDEAVMATQSMLLTFTKIKGPILQGATQAALDMAQALGMDGTQAAMQLGKALNAPATGLTKLQRIGVTFSDAQKKQIETMVAANNTAGAQSVILKELQTEFGGSAVAAGKTFSGQLTILKNTFGDLQESVGQVILQGLAPLATAFSGWLQRVQAAGGMIAYFQAIFEAHKQVIYAIAGAISIALLPALVAMATAMWATFAPLLPFLAIGAAVGLLVYNLSQRFGGLRGLLQQIMPFLSMLGDVFRTIIWPAIKQVFDVIVNSLLPSLLRLWDIAKPILIPILKILAVVIGVTLVAGLWVAINVLRILIGWLANMINWLGNAIAWVKNFVVAVGRWFGSIPGSISGALSGVWGAITNPFKKAFDWIENQTNRVKGFLNKLNPFAKGSPSLVDYVKSGTRVIQGEYAGLFDAINRGVQGVSGEGIAMRLPATAPSTTAAPAPSGGVFQPTLHVNLGMYAGMPVEKRQIAVELWREIVREARSQGVQLPQIGVSSQ